MPGKKESNVINFYTKRPLNNKGNYDVDVAEKGIYLGVLKKEDGVLASRLIEQLSIKNEQIQCLTREFDKLNERYHQLLATSLDYLKAEAINLTSDDIYIDRNSHVWVVKKDW